MLQYSDRKLKLFPPKPINERLKLQKRPASPAALCNFDIFDVNKKVLPACQVRKVKSKVNDSINSTGYQAPMYIGQNVYIRPTYIVSLPEYSFSNWSESAAFIENKKNLAVKDHKGAISNKADKKLRNAINWLLCSASPKKVFHKAKNTWFDFKVNFITLTLPDTAQEITDKDFKTKLLNPWLTYMRQYHGLKNYVWKLEFQKNGKLHLHITSDTFIHYKQVQKTWNKLLGANGYLIDFAKKFGHINPNSTDIHSVRKIKNLGAYLAKYMSKADAMLAKVKGRIWGCNYELSRANKTKLFIDRVTACTEMRPLMSPNIDYKKMQIVDTKTGLIKDRGEIFYLTYNNWLNDITGIIKDEFNTTILGLKNIEHDGTLFKDLLEV